MEVDKIGLRSRYCYIYTIITNLLGFVCDKGYIYINSRWANWLRKKSGFGKIPESALGCRSNV